MITAKRAATTVRILRSEVERARRLEAIAIEARVAAEDSLAAAIRIADLAAQREATEKMP
jgi:hypothetical protein